MSIAKQDFDNLMNRARVLITGASDAGIKAELFDVFTEFFAASSCWMESLQINVVTDTTTYNVTPSEGQIIRLIGVFDSEAHPQSALMPVVGQIVLANPPNIAQAPLYFNVLVSKNVGLPTTKDMVPVGPDWVLPMYHNVILSGLQGSMLLQPGKSWSNKETAVYHLKRFRDGIAGARIAAVRQNTWAAQSWRFPGFATGTQLAASGSTDRSF